MAYLAVDEDGTEWIYDILPTRSDRWQGSWGGGYSISLKSGDIKKLTGITLTWNDEPIEHKGY